MSGLVLDSDYDKRGSLTEEAWARINPGVTRCSRRRAINEQDSDTDDYTGRSYTYWCFSGRTSLCNEKARYEAATTGRPYCARCLPWNVNEVRCIRCGTVHAFDSCCGSRLAALEAAQ